MHVPEDTQQTPAPEWADVIRKFESGEWIVGTPCDADGNPWSSRDRRNLDRAIAKAFGFSASPTMVFHYVVLRIGGGDLRDERVNVGIVLFAEESAGLPPSAILMATPNKLLAVDGRWDQAHLNRWKMNIEEIMAHERTSQDIVNSLAMWGFCDAQAMGMFTASSQPEFAAELADIKSTYVSA